jgi:hypothetical protein
MPATLDTDLADLLHELSSAQEESLDVLSRKRQLLATIDLDGLAAIAPREEQVIARLQKCLERRQALLDRAASEGLPSDNIRSLATALPDSGRPERSQQLQQAASRARLLQHQSLTNWVLIQRTLLHLSQMLEIIATGGRQKPTYSKGNDAHDRGALVDHVA